MGNKPAIFDDDHNVWVDYHDNDNNHHHNDHHCIVGVVYKDISRQLYNTGI
jgi:hypothetical protein